MKPGPKPKKDKMKAISICLPTSMIKRIHEVKKPDESVSRFIQSSLKYFCKALGRINGF